MLRSLSLFIFQQSFILVIYCIFIILNLKITPMIYLPICKLSQWYILRLLFISLYRHHEITININILYTVALQTM